jgi:hypothetical protein
MPILRGPSVRFAPLGEVQFGGANSVIARFSVVIDTFFFHYRSLSL